MELRHLRYFVFVAEDLHFGRAAARLGISQPPLSQQIRSLEDEMGVILFDRTSRRVELTSAGHAFLAEARKALDQVGHAVQVAQRAGRGEVGELAIGYTASAPFTPIMSRALFRFREAYPSVHLELSEMGRRQQVDAMTEHRIDIGFLRGQEPPSVASSILCTALMEEPMLVAMRSDHRLAGREAVRVDDLAGERFVLYEREQGAGVTDHLELIWRRAGQEMVIAQETRELSTLLGLVAAGMGVTILSKSLSALHADNVIYLPLDDSDAVSRMWLIHPVLPSAPCRNFIDILRQISEDERK